MHEGEDPTMRTGPAPQDEEAMARELAQAAVKGSGGLVNGPVYMGSGGVMGLGSSYTPPSPEEIRLAKIEQLATLMLMERSRQGSHGVDVAGECAREAKALYAELDRKDEG